MNILVVDLTYAKYKLKRCTLVNYKSSHPMTLVKSHMYFNLFDHKAGSTVILLIDSASSVDDRKVGGGKDLGSS